MTSSSCGRVLLPVLLVWLGVVATPAQRADRPSIHVVESQSHRDWVVHPAESRAALAPIVPTAASNLTHTVFGFYPYWAPGYSQLRFRDITHLAVFSVEAAGTGQLVNLRGWPNGPLIETAHQNSVRVILVCTLFDATQIQSLLASATARQTLIANLREQLMRGGADGVNIDFEGVPGSQRSNLVLFMRDLATALRTAVPGAHISIDTPAVDWSNAFDYAALADICDALMIMAYDYHWSAAPSPGPVAPLASSSLWGTLSVRASVADYLTKVGAARSGKLVLGVPYYGYDWPAESDAPNAKALGRASSKLYTAATSEANLYGRRWDAASSTPWYTFQSQAIHQVWYDDATSLAGKYDVVFQNGLQGIGIWALTYDRDTQELWDLIESRFAPPLPEAPEVIAPPTFFDTVGLPLSLRARGSVAATAFELAVGTTPGGTDVSGFRSVGMRRQVLIQDIALIPGRTYYVSARSVGARAIAGMPGTPVAVRIDAAASPKSLFVPGWIANSDIFSGLASVNISGIVQALLLRAYLPDRPQPLNASWVLQPGEQAAELLSETDTFGSQVSGREGWLEVSFPGSAWPAMFVLGDTSVSRTLAGGPLADRARVQVLPELDGGRARFDVVNPGPGTALLQIRLVKADGGSAVAVRSLAAAERLSQIVTELFPEVATPASQRREAGSGPARTPFLIVDADRPLVCAATLGRSGDSGFLGGQDVARAERTGGFAYAPIGGGYRSQATIVNPTSEAQTVQLRWVGGSAPAGATVELPPMGSWSADLAELFAIPPAVNGSTVGGAVQLTVLRGTGVVGSLWIRTDDCGLMTLLPLEALTVKDFIFPQLAQSQGYWTGLSLANPNSTLCSVNVGAFDAAGRSLGETVRQLVPGEIQIGLLSEWLSATQGTGAGRVEVRSSCAILAAEIFGSDSLRFLEAVPGR